VTVLAFERFTVMPGSEDRLRDLTEGTLRALRNAPGALWADIAGTDDGFMIVAEWRSAGDVDAWDEGETARTFIQGLDALLVGERTRRRFGALH
jgi:quinol monooxygenase YgiN